MSEVECKYIFKDKQEKLSTVENEFIHCLIFKNNGSCQTCTILKVLHVFFKQL